MSIDEFLESMQLLSGAYRDDRYISKQTLDTWHKYFGEYDCEAFEKAVDKWITEKPQSPQISDLIPKCKYWQKRVNENKEHDKLDDYLGTEEDKAAHPYEEGWRVDDDNKWVQLRVY